MTLNLLSHPRFEIRRRLGRGASGSVFSAWDRVRGEVVALKALHQHEPGAIYRFKKEFRLLAEVVHPNLVSLYELFAEGDHLFFTMELVDGEDLLSWVRRADLDSEAETLPSKPRADEDRLRAALLQLTVGLRALHASGRLHCDLKPTNVLVTPRGRVVILDFGVGRHFGELSVEESVQEGLSGTIHYMAPEQALGEEARPASDWYAMGVILHQALTGTLPYGGSAVQILYEKSRHPVRSPAELVSGLPQDFVDLCLRLLAIDPDQRPEGAEIEALLTGRGAADSQDPPTGVDLDPDDQPALIGRERELEILEAAFEACREGEQQVFWIHGESGMGKSSFLRAALRTFRRRSDAVVLTGRCFDRELMPYKALDGVLDSLTRFLRTLSAQEAEIYFPRGLHALTRIFPVLLRVDAVAQAVAGRTESPDEMVQRRRAFTALRELFERLAHRRPLIVHIDDLQWADADSMTLLEELLRPPDPPPFLLVAAFRSEEIPRRDFLSELIERADADQRRVLELAPLSHEDAESLVRWRLGADASDETVERVVKEAHGSPFFIEQLTGVARGEVREGGDLAATLAARLEELPAGCAEILNLLVVARRPLDAAQAARAAGVEGDLPSLLSALRAARLVSVRGSAGRIELYHDRIREVLHPRLSKAERKALHARLADTVVQSDDSEMLFEHLFRSGDLRGAASHAAAAAEKARQSLAFDRAAQLYRRALDLGHPEAAERRDLQRRLAESLAHAGRPRRAAEAFLDAARDADPAEALRLRQAAAHEFFTGGYMDEGWKLTKEVCAQVGLRVGSDRWTTRCSIFWNRRLLKFRGFEFERRTEEEVDSDELLRIDTSWSAAMALSSIQPLYGFDLQLRHLRRALRVGEPRRVSRAMAMQASYEALTNADDAEQVGLRAQRIAKTTEDPGVEGIAILHLGVSDYLSGRWRSGLVRCEEAVAIFSDRCTGMLWEIGTARRFTVLSLNALGEIERLRALGAADLAEAGEIGDAQAMNFLRIRMTLVRLADDDPDAARRENDLAWDFLDRLPFLILHVTAFFSRIDLEIYAGRIDDAWRLFKEKWPEIRRSPLLRVGMLRCEAKFVVGRLALARAISGDRAAADLAADLAAELAREKLACAAAYSDLLRAGVASLRDETHVAQALLSEGLGRCERLEMQGLAESARLQQSRLAGRSTPAATEEWFAREGVLRPERFSQAFVPILRS